MGVYTETGYIVVDRMVFTTTAGNDIHCECTLIGYSSRDNKSVTIELPITRILLEIPRLEFVYPDIVYNRVYTAILNTYPGSVSVFEEGQPLSVFDEEGYDKNGFNLTGYNREGIPRRSLDASKDVVYYNDDGPIPPPMT
jgi:hypothetical protein